MIAVNEVLGQVYLAMFSSSLGGTRAYLPWSFHRGLVETAVRWDRKTVFTLAILLPESLITLPRSDGGPVTGRQAMREMQSGPSPQSKCDPKLLDDPMQRRHARRDDGCTAFDLLMCRVDVKRGEWEPRRPPRSCCIDGYPRETL